MACGGIIPGEFRPEIGVAALLERLNDLADEPFGFEVGHITIVTI